MSLTIEDATRTGLTPLVGVYGKSGTGKTHSALLLAAGMAGGKDVAIIDTERKRSGALVGLVPFNFKRINLDAPFTPESYGEAIRLMEDSNIGCGVIDSLTHEWDGEGGILEMQEAELDRMAGQDWKKREACKMAAWIKPKMRHKALIAQILRSKIPLVCCLRADEKTHVDRGDGKTKVITDDFSTPIFDKRFIFEMLANLETVQVSGKPGCARITKWTHPEILNCLPREGEQITMAHGAALARWCGLAGQPVPAPGEAPGVKKLKRELWELTAALHNGNPAALEQWLWDEMLLAPTCTLAALSELELSAVISAARKKLKK